MQNTAELLRQIKLVVHVRVDFKFDLSDPLTPVSSSMTDNNTMSIPVCVYITIFYMHILIYTCMCIVFVYYALYIVHVHVHKCLC